jgi:Holliday junction resolvasome RuvABC endonuclease subunit
MLSLGLDPSLTGFGWCIHDANASGKKRVVDKGRFASPASDVFVSRYIGLRECVENLLDDWPEIQIVGVESPPFGELWSEGLYGLFLYVNEAIYTRRKDVVYFDPLTVKLLAKEDPTVRRGMMFKADMVAMAKADTGISRWNGDEADAYHISRFAARFWLLLTGRIDKDVLLPSEQHVFFNEKTFSKGKHAGETHQRGTLFREGERFYRFSQLPESK